MDRRRMYFLILNNWLFKDILFTTWQSTFILFICTAFAGSISTSNSTSILGFNLTSIFGSYFCCHNCGEQNIWNSRPCSSVLHPQQLARIWPGPWPIVRVVLTAQHRQSTYHNSFRRNHPHSLFRRHTSRRLECRYFLPRSWKDWKGTSFLQRDTVTPWKF